MRDATAARWACTSLLLMTLWAAAPHARAEDQCFAQCSGGLGSAGDRAPSKGQAAPDFSAVRFDPGTGVAEPRSLETLLDERPLILAFGSYT